MAPHSSTLAWKIPWMEEPGRVAKSRTRLSKFTFTFHFHALEKEMATHSCVLSWRISGTAEPGGLPSMGSHRVRHSWSDLAAAAAAAAAAAEVRNQKVCFLSVQFSHSVVRLFVTPCRTPCFPVHHQPLEPTQTHVHWVGDAIQKSRPLLFPSPPTFNLS